MLPATPATSFLTATEGVRRTPSAPPMPIPAAFPSLRRAGRLVAAPLLLAAVAVSPAPGRAAEPGPPEPVAGERPAAQTTASENAATETAAPETAAPETPAAENDANRANNPLAILPALQVQTYYQPSFRPSSGVSGVIQPILRTIQPFKGFGGTNLLRVSLPGPTAAWGPDGHATGLGDLTLFSVRVFPIRPNAGIGIGPLLVAPTASADSLGSRQWQVGAQGTLSAHFPWGLLAALVSYQQSFDGQTNALTIQPFVFRNIGDGFYLRSSAITSLNVRSGDGVIPVGLGLGRVTRLTSGNLLNVYVEPQLSLLARGDAQPTFQLFAGFNLQFPRR